MMTINARMMQLIGPRDRKGDCAVRALTYITKADYTDIEDAIIREQPTYKPHNPTKGVYCSELLKVQRTFFGMTFTRVMDIQDVTVGYVRKVYDKGTFLICIRNHAFVIQDGKVLDANDTPDDTKVVGGWQAEKKSLQQHAA